jgi:hypothetical protein
VDEDTFADGLRLQGDGRPRMTGGIVQQGRQDSGHHIGRDSDLDIVRGSDSHSAPLTSLS